MNKGQKIWKKQVGKNQANWFGQNDALNNIRWRKVLESIAGHEVNLPTSYKDNVRYKMWTTSRQGILNVRVCLNTVKQNCALSICARIP